MKYDYPILVTGGEGEREFGGRITENLAGVTNLVGKLKLEEMIYLLGGSSLFISPDTGPMHLAVALGIKTLTLFGPSDIKKYAPYGNGPRHIVAQPESMECLNCNRIRRPPKKCFTGGVSNCMRSIRVEDCIDKIESLIKLKGK